MSSKEITAKKSLKVYNRADQIIRFLTNPDDETILLTDREKHTLEVCTKIHGYRLKYWKKSQLIAFLRSTERIGDRQARNLINDTERIFGTVERVNKEYERNWLLEVSRENIKRLTEAGKDTTKAIDKHYKIAGLEEFMPDMPDFEKLEIPQQVINLPPGTLDLLKNIMKMGSIKLQDVIPAPNHINTSSTEEAQEVK